MDDVFLLSRIQFALTIMFHYLFPPLSIGLGAIMVIMEGMYLRTGAAVYHNMTRFWSRVFAVNFALNGEVTAERYGEFIFLCAGRSGQKKSGGEEQAADNQRACTHAPVRCRQAVHRLSAFYSRAVRPATAATRGFLPLTIVWPSARSLAACFATPPGNLGFSAPSSETTRQ